MIFGGPETQHGELFPHRRTFFCLAEKNSEFTTEISFCEFGFCFAQKNVIRWKKSLSRKFRFPVATWGGIRRHWEWQKIGCLLFVSACRAVLLLNLRLRQIELPLVNFAPPRPTWAGTRIYFLHASGNLNTKPHVHA